MKLAEFLRRFPPSTRIGQHDTGSQRLTYYDDGRQVVRTRLHYLSGRYDIEKLSDQEAAAARDWCARRNRPLPH